MTRTPGRCASNPERLRAHWEERVAGVDGHISVTLRSVDLVFAERDAMHQHYAASTMKVAVLVALLQARAAATISDQDSVLVQPRFPSAVGGTFDLQQADDQDDQTWSRRGSRLGLLELAEPMITRSSNIATDLIATRLGLAAIADFLDRAGLADGLSVQRLIGDSAAADAGLTNVATARGLAALVAGIAGARWLSPSDSQTALSILARQTHRNGIPAGLPPDTWSASKGGWVAGVRHDVALVRPAAAPPYVLAICTTSALPDQDALTLIADLTRITDQEWTSWHAS